MSQPTPRYVAQEDHFGCLVACVAMVTGRSYQETKAPIVAGGFYDLSRSGLVDHMAWALLGDAGYSTQQQYRTNPYTNKPRPQWPPAPFAPVHLACVDTPRGTHMVVWLPSGQVLDPARPGHYTLDDYGRPLYIIGVYPISS